MAKPLDREQSELVVDRGIYQILRHKALVVKDDKRFDDYCAQIRRIDRKLGITGE